MYKISDKPAAIREVQKYLRLIGYDSYPVIVSGVYDDKTELAVKDFQTSNGIEVTGEVDEITFARLYGKYRAASRLKELREKTDPLITFPLTAGTVSDEMLHINRMISKLLKKYGIAKHFRVSRTFGKDTEAGVVELRGIYGIDGSGIIDEELYIRIFDDHDSVFEFEN